MLKKNIKDYDLNIFKELDDRWGILTAGDKTTGFNSMTVSWGGIGVLWGKMVAYIFVRKSRYTYEFMEKSQSVTLSFLPSEYKEQAKVFGNTSGRLVDKVKAAGLNYTYDPDFDGAYIKECDYTFKMKTLYEINLPITDLDQTILDRYYPNGDEHTMYVCEIKQYLVKNNK